MTRVDLTRHVAANPASVALLLAGPTVDLVSGVAGRLPARPDDAAPLDVTVAAPRRDGVGFVSDVTVVADRGTRARGVARGVLTVVPADRPGCDIRIRLDAAENLHAEPQVRAFLDVLAEHALARALAA